MPHNSAEATQPRVLWLKRLATAPGRPPSALERLREAPPDDGLASWVMTLAITATAFVLRLWNIGQPAAIMFDESMYAKAGFSLYQYGYQGTWTDDFAADMAVVHGDTSALTSVGSFASHPTVGTWLIGAGTQVFGMNPTGWRIASVIFGALLVLMVIRLARRLSRSTLVGGLAGLLLTVDGLSFVLSRVALLDVFETFFIVAGAAAVLADRDYFRHKLADALQKTNTGSFEGKPGPFVFRPWLIVAGLMFGLACATKWNAVYPLALFGVMSVVWTITARHLAGAGRSAWWSLLKDGVPAFVSMVVVSVGVYIATWASWLATSGGYDRQWGAANPSNWVVRHFGTALGSLWQYTVDMYNWQTGPQMADPSHPYAISPWRLPFATNTIGMYAQTDIAPGTQGCHAAVDDTCMRVVTGLGTPFLWWGAALALLIGLVWWLIFRDQRFSVVILATCSIWAPWLFASHRIFVYYASTMIPFMVIGLAMVLGAAMGPSPTWRRPRLRVILVVSYVALVIADFVFNYPIYTGQLLAMSHWMWRMWLPTWI